jgi:ribosomal protein S18 acetylase RimI-like enzyme
MNVRVRSAIESDGHEVGALHAASWKHAYRGALSDEYLAGDVERDRMQLWKSRLAEPSEHQHLLLAEDAGRLLGFVCFYGDENEEWGSYLNNIHVAQSAQRMGIGRLLLHSTAELCDNAYPGASTCGYSSPTLVLRVSTHVSAPGTPGLTYGRLREEPWRQSFASLGKASDSCARSRLTHRFSVPRSAAAESIGSPGKRVQRSRTQPCRIAN